MFFVAFHRAILGLNYTMTRIKKSEKIDLCQKTTFEKVCILLPNVCGRSGSRRLTCQLLYALPATQNQ